MTAPFRASFKRRASIVVAAAVCVVLATRLVSAFRTFSRSGATKTRGVLTAPSGNRDTSTAGAQTVQVTIPDSMRGRSGAVRFATLTPAEAEVLPGFLRRFGEAALHTPGARVVIQGADTFALITLRPFADKHGEFVNRYRLGRWPAERWMMARNYYNPDGFVDVTPETALLPLSPHFALGEFVTHDKQDVWPKYVVLEEKLIDKLELVLRDLAAHGYSANHVVVLSGFRAPYYNELGVGEGMARASRHQYGDAADIIIDNDRNGSMDDLVKDGRIDLRDVRPITDAIERVEAQYPDLVGGLGTYAAMGPRGPFAHVDVRGTSARWERAQGRR